MLSQVLSEIVTGPNGEPPVGGLKIPVTRKGTVFPVGAVSDSREPTLRWCDFAKLLSTNDPSLPRLAMTALLPPSSQLIRKIVEPSGLTAVAWCTFLKMS